MNIKPVYTDSVLYVAIAICGFLETEFGSDAAYKYINPYTLFWTKVIVGTIGAGAGALKMFRSTTYSDHVASLKKEEVAAVIDIPPIKPILPPLQPTQQPQNLNTKV